MITLEYRETTAYGSMRKSYKAWLLTDEKPIAYIHLLAAPSDETIMCVCSIESRDGYQAQGYARELMTQIAKVLNVTLATSGSFTPEGYKAIGHNLPLAPGYSEYKVNCDSMDFVRNWDAKQSY